jgi:hypothetical protein
MFVQNRFLYLILTRPKFALTFLFFKRVERRRPFLYSSFDSLRASVCRIDIDIWADGSIEPGALHSVENRP